MTSNLDQIARTIGAIRPTTVEKLMTILGEYHPGALVVPSSLLDSVRTDWTIYANGHPLIGIVGPKTNELLGS